MSQRSTRGGDNIDSEALNGATSVQVYIDILASYLASGATLAVSLVAQQSFDAIDWDIDSVVSLTSWTAVGKNSVRVALPDRAEFGPHLRLGLQIANSAVASSDMAKNAQVAAQLSCTVVPFGGDNEVAANSLSVVASAATGNITTSLLQTTGLSTLVVGVRAADFGGSQTWIGVVRGSFDGTNWYNLPCDVNGVAALTGAFTLTQGGTEASIIRCQTLPAWVMLVKTGGTAAAGTVAIEEIGRGF